MIQLNIPFSSTIDSLSDLQEVSLLMDLQNKHAIGATPWASYPYQPKVHFNISYGVDCIFLKYYVKENSIRALHRKINSPVHTDTCVEFFIGFGNQPAYYNFEFNCMGTCQAGYGTNRENRHLLAETVIRNISCLPYLKHIAGNFSIYWELTLIIPFGVFQHHNVSSLANTVCRMNFYKCGDELPVPHYLAWNTIVSNEPNFHLPQFFGEGYFTDITDQLSI